MKRKVLLLITAGIAAGLVYVLEINRRKRVTANREPASGATANDSEAKPNGGASMATVENEKATVWQREDQHRSTIRARLKRRLHKF